MKRMPHGLVAAALVALAGCGDIPLLGVQTSLASFGSPDAAMPQQGNANKPLLLFPLRYAADKTIVAWKGGIRSTTPRISYGESHANAGRRHKQNVLTITDSFSLYKDMSFSSLRWQIRATEGVRGVELSLLSCAPDYERLKAMRPWEKTEVSLCYRAASELVVVKCSRAMSKECFGSMIEAVYFDLSTDALLDITDCGRVSVEYSGGRTQLNLDDSDVESVRWFVWHAALNGKQLIANRYDCHQR